jgi:hypothetical protein
LEKKGLEAEKGKGKDKDKDKDREVDAPAGADVVSPATVAAPASVDATAVGSPVSTGGCRFGGLLENCVFRLQHAYCSVAARSAVAVPWC